MAKSKNYLVGRIKSFGFAFKGIAILFRTQANAQIHAVAIVLISIIGYLFHLSTIEWCLLIVCMAMVLMAEAINTALEFLVDLVSPEYHELAGKVKDVAAGAVLLSVIFCGIVWGIIHIPKIMLLLQ